jgi:EAL domain-containing protein (putative c-di-GMP-specific phosphodiesterase class I)
MDEALQRKRDVGQVLREAINQGALELHYQPVVDNHTGRIVACEALVRLRHPVNGLVPPSEFIEIAEQTGLIVPLGDWVLRKACKDAASWPKHVRVAVNFSPKQFVICKDLIADIREALADSGLPAHRLEVEVTESTIIEAKDSLAMLSEISALGVKISLDDFGTGYSSLSYLHALAIDAIKIDKSFTQAIGTEAVTVSILPQILSMAATLKLQVIVEGVETKAQSDYFLAASQPVLAQGWYFGRPVSIEQFQSLLDEERKTLAAESDSAELSHVQVA